MQIIHDTFYGAMALAAGAGIGWAFGSLQQLALRHHQRRQDQGQYTGPAAAMPGSFRRIAFLLLALAVLQIAFPQLFPGVNKWLVTGGLVLGYGWLPFRRLCRRGPREY